MQNHNHIFDAPYKKLKFHILHRRVYTAQALAPLSQNSGCCVVTGPVPRTLVMIKILNFKRSTKL